MKSPFQKYSSHTLSISTHLPGNGRVINVGGARRRGRGRGRQLAEGARGALTLTRRSRTNDKAPNGDGNGSEKGRRRRRDQEAARQQQQQRRLTRRIEGRGHVARRTNERERSVAVGRGLRCPIILWDTL